MKKHIPLSARQLLVTAALLLSLSSLTLFLFTFRQDEKHFLSLTSHLFEEDITASTINMHYSLAHPENFGIDDYDVILPLCDAEAVKDSTINIENTLSALKHIHSDRLSEQDAYLYHLLTRSLENSLVLNSYPYFQEPLSPASGMQVQLPVLLAEYTFRTRRDVEDYLALLDQTDEYFESVLTFEKEKSAAGLCMPSSALKEVRKQCDTVVTLKDLEQGGHFLQTTFAERLESLRSEGIINDSDVSSYIAQNNRLLKTVLLPAYISLGDGLILLEDSGTEFAGLSSYPGGREYYCALMASETGSQRSPEQIQDMLTKQFFLVYDSLQNLILSHPEAAEEYTSAHEIAFPCKQISEMLTDLQERMASDFPDIPEGGATATVKSVSDNLDNYCAPAFYLTAPLDDISRNVIYINNAKTPEGLELYTTLAHESYPGHLYQTVYANRSSMEKGELPLRKLLWYGGYLEGWALYGEFLSYDYASELMMERGMEQEAFYAQIEKYNRSLQLCLYSMLDIMIHYEGASLTEVTNLLREFGIGDDSSALAIYSYIALEPCNYLKYYVGYLEILELKAAAQKRWGDSYSDYRFHTFLLDAGPSDFTALNELLAQ